MTRAYILKRLREIWENELTAGQRAEFKSMKDALAWYAAWNNAEQLVDGGHKELARFLLSTNWEAVENWALNKIITDIFPVELEEAEVEIMLNSVDRFWREG